MLHFLNATPQTSLCFVIASYATIYCCKLYTREPFVFSSYFEFFFDCIPGYGLLKNKAVICFLSVIVMGLYFVCTYMCNRSIFNVLLNVLFPFCSYTFLCCAPYFSFLLGILLFVFTVVNFFRKSKGNNIKRVINLRIKNWIRSMTFLP